MFALLEGYSSLGFIESCTDFFTFEESIIECLCKENGRSIEDLTILLDTDNMASSMPLKDTSNPLRLACCHKDNFKFLLCLLHELTQLMGTDKIPTSIIVLKEQKMALIRRFLLIEAHCRRL